MLPKLIAIVGQTASGKTGLGIEIAKKFSGEVVSVDSRQVYRGMDIGTAKVGKERKVGKVGYDREEKTVDGILHWGIDLVDPDEDYSVADFKKYSEQKIDEIIQRKRIPILVGGTGLWVSSLIDNFDLTNIPADFKLRVELESRSLDDLFAEYKQLDPKGAEVIDKDNKRRIVRALEVTKLSGKTFFEKQTKGNPRYDVLQIGLLVDRQELNARIDLRVDEMVENGLVDEVRSLNDKYGCEIYSMSGIGYRQICSFLKGETALDEAIEETKKATRHYAKRQMTWFKRDPRIKWISSSDEAFQFISDFLA
ncbi:tRNA (adenosine(37)-N6)-dimethylallyltransferase MiaA [Candidatus Uhrbacteria bacterium]|nr:tRNA (adenosine(37)-N6)-dimethylallyltransferase MiaA [Candidatus Uhrbacteria bacterium]